MPSSLLRLLALLPLNAIHGAGVLLGWGVYLFSATYRRLLQENLERAHCHSNREEYNVLLKKSIAEAGKGVAELLKIWFGDRNKVVDLVVEVDDWRLVDEAQERGKGIIFLTPHLGCFDISALYAAVKMPFTALYREPKIRWLNSWMIEGRRPMQLAPANLQGVKRLFKALKKNEAIGLLPDQAPGAGDGVWASFFGRPAYTMTLVSRLHESTGAAVILAFARRLPRGGGYRLSLFPVADASPEAINREVERLVRSAPEQYLWSYNRYKTPAGAAPRVEGA